MKIALLADSRKHELLVNFCIAYRHILVQHELISFFTTARLIEQATKLRAKPLVGDIEASIGQLASSALYNEVDAILYLRDPEISEYDRPNLLLRACDQNSIPIATNMATAEVLILAIENGDLDWRELVR